MAELVVDLREEIKPIRKCYERGTLSQILATKVEKCLVLWVVLKKPAVLCC
jgi:hypothetical protein